VASLFSEVAMLRGIVLRRMAVFRSTSFSLCGFDFAHDQECTQTNVPALFE